MPKREANDRLRSLAEEIVRLRDAGPAWDLFYAAGRDVIDPGGRRRSLCLDLGGGRYSHLAWVYPDSPEDAALSHLRALALAAAELARLVMGGTDSPGGSG